MMPVTHGLFRRSLTVKPVVSLAGESKLCLKKTTADYDEVQMKAVCLR